MNYIMLKLKGCTIMSEKLEKMLLEMNGKLERLKATVNRIETNQNGHIEMLKKISKNLDR